MDKIVKQGETKIIDRSSYSNHANYMGLNTKFVQGARFGTRALLFPSRGDQSNDKIARIELTDPTQLKSFNYNNKEDMTIEIYFKAFPPASGGDEEYSVIEKGDATGESHESQSHWWLHLNNAGIPEFQLKFKDREATKLEPTGVQTIYGEWHHVAISYNAWTRDLRMYIDHVEVANEQCPTLKYGVNALAGSGSPGSANGIRDSAMFNKPGGVALTSDNAYAFIADTESGTIRKLNIEDMSVSLVAGASDAGCETIDSADHASVRFCKPQDITIDPTGSYALVVDRSHHVIRKVELNTGATELYAGQKELSGDSDGTRLNASLKILKE